MTNYTILEYQYRDAGNYKAFGELLIEGEMTPNDLAALIPYLYDGEYFIPEEVGIPSLQPKLWDENSGPNEDDHEWHTFENIKEVNSEDRKLSVWGTKEGLIQRFRDKNNRLKTNQQEIIT